MVDILNIDQGSNPAFSAIIYYKINGLYINIAQMLSVHLGRLCPMLLIIANPPSICFSCN